jgi:hypothetical protein
MKRVRTAFLLAAVILSIPSGRAQSNGAPGAAEVLDHGYLKIGFDQLASYPFTPPQYEPSLPPGAKLATGEEQIPAVIKALNGRKVVIAGYMVPVKMDKGLVTELLLMRNTQACCFGAIPNMNEWVVVKMPQGVRPLMDTPLFFYGQLKVGAQFESGYITGLYELTAEKMSEAK